MPAGIGQTTKGEKRWGVRPKITMALLDLSWVTQHTFASLLRQVPIRSMQHVSVALQYDEAFSFYSRLIKCKI